jgi:tRNA threonylcarbamoyl adenosine modification protein (Sua5/YciO/YrdC/YwlC family)
VSDLAAVLAALDSGAVIGIPTDTVYGLGADAFCESAVEALFAVKRRPGVKPVPILVASPEQAARVAVLDGRARAAAAEHWPGPLTLVLPRVAGLPDWVGSEATESVGIRVPDHPAALEVLAVRGPLAVTSANRSGADPVLSAEEAADEFGDEVAAYVPGRSGGGLPSTVVDLTGPAARVLRPGPIEWDVS